MEVVETNIEGVKLIRPRIFEDERGAFLETYSCGRYLEAGIDVEFVQDNLVLSRPKGTMRGLHFQSPPHAQAKL
ncbi:MAG: dTDP-4-dehydrorhamnose 3,5-epimerase family protein, partial [Rhodospirillales bacterium]